jgi:hypothetical protein
VNNSYGRLNVCAPREIKHVFKCPSDSVGLNAMVKLDHEGHDEWYRASTVMEYRLNMKDMSSLA